jgi:hypothetical protein
VFSFQPVLPPDWRPLFVVNDEVGQALYAVTGTRHWASLSLLIFFLCSCGHRGLALVQWFVNFSAGPEMMQQHRQLACGGDNGSLFSVSSTALGQLQSPASQVAIGTERSQDVLCSLHQQRPQIRIAFFADVQLRLALPGVSSSRL